MRYLGIDFGTKRIGLAISDEMGIIAGKYGTITRKGTRQDVERIKEIVRKEGVQTVVIGYPRNMDGSTGKTAEMVEEFVSAMRGVLEIPIERWDERLSSALAEKTLVRGDVSRRKRRKVIDQLSAVIILQNYLDHQKFARS